MDASNNRALKYIKEKMRFNDIIDNFRIIVVDFNSLFSITNKRIILKISVKIKWYDLCKRANTSLRQLKESYTNAMAHINLWNSIYQWSKKCI